MIRTSERSISTPRPARSAMWSDAAPPIRIVVVDDDDEFRQSLSLSLIEEGFAVTSFARGAAALEYVVSGKPADVILLDWRMPGMTGLEVLRGLRKRGATNPVIFLTGLSDDVYEDEALGGGAVDFIGKSRRLSILIRRIELIIETGRPAELRPQMPDTVRIGALELRFDTNRALWHGHTVDLTLTEFQILARLALKAGEDFSYRKLYDLARDGSLHVGNGAEGYRANVRAFIKRIRNKFREIDPAFDQIHNYAKFGYRWVVS